jgi:hypothetical protein
VRLIVIGKIFPSSSFIAMSIGLAAPVETV